MKNLNRKTFINPTSTFLGEFWILHKGKIDFNQSLKTVLFL